MICKNCAAEYDDSYSFCPVCGKEKFSVEIPEYPEYVPQTEHMEFTDISSFSDNVIRDAAEDYPQEESVYAENNDNAGYYDIDASEDADTNVYSEAPQEEEGHDATQIFSLEQEAESVEAEDTDEPAYENGEQNAEQVQQEAEKPVEAEVKIEEASEEKTEAQPVRKRPVRRAPVVNKKEENKTLAVIIAVMCVVAVLAGVLSGIKLSTDTLETTEPAEKVVAAVGFSTQEEIMLEEVVARCFSALRTDYNSEVTDAETFLEKINPYDKGGVYSRVYNEYPELNKEKDPAGRFYDEEAEEYAYYKIEEKKIDDLLSIFSIAPHHQINRENCYYYDGYYYFAYKQQKNTAVVKTEITKSKRALDGSYYSECYFYAESGEKRVQTDNYYLVTEKTGDLQSGTVSFKIKRISTTPIFDNSGKLVEERTYKIKKQTIEGKTDDGKVYCRYTFEYPEFNDSNVGYQAINTFFTDAINVYKLKAESAQSSYESYIQQGGKDSDLPIEESVVARVSYENEQYVSIVEKIGIKDPTAVQSAPVTVQSEEEGSDEDYEEEPAEESLTLFNRMVDGYVFDKATGEFVSKDVLVGKDYMAVSEILYRIYNGYEYDSIIPEVKTEEVTDEYGEVVEDDEYYEDEEEEYYYSDDEIPDDEDGFGTVIYESACAFTQKGLTFYYVNEYGFVEEVTIPYAVVERLAQ